MSTGIIRNSNIEVMLSKINNKQYFCFLTFSNATILLTFLDKGYLP